MTDLAAIGKVLAIAFTCGLVLLLTNWLTADRIAFNEEASLRQFISELLPGNTPIETPVPALDRVPGVWRLCTGQLLGRSDTGGYAGPIRLLYTLNDDAGTLIRLAVLDHQETPGITDFLSDPHWWAGFQNQRSDAIGRLATITGATITSRAIIEHLVRVTAEPDEVLGELQMLDCES